MLLFRRMNVLSNHSLYVWLPFFEPWLRLANSFLFMIFDISHSLTFESWFRCVTIIQKTEYCFPGDGRLSRYSPFVCMPIVITVILIVAIVRVIDILLNDLECHLHCHCWHYYQFSYLSSMLASLWLKFLLSIVLCCLLFCNTAASKPNSNINVWNVQSLLLYDSAFIILFLLYPDFVWVWTFNHCSNWSNIVSNWFGLHLAGINLVACLFCLLKKRKTEWNLWLKFCQMSGA